MFINFNAVSHEYLQKIWKIIRMIFSDVSLGMIYWVLVYWYIWYAYSVSYREKYWLHISESEKVREREYRKSVSRLLREQLG